MKSNKWFWAIFSILSAVFLIASQVTDFVQIGVWSILGLILITAIVIQSIIHLNFFGVFVPLVFAYQILWQPLNLVDISIWILLASAVLLSIGFSFIFRKRPPKYYKGKWEKGEHFNETIENIDDNNPYAKVSFGASTKYLHSDALKSGQFYTSFGALEVYMDQSQISPDGAEIFVDCSFGSIELYVPRSWNVKSKVRVSLGAADINERRSNQDQNAPTLSITGNVSFGSVEVNYI